MYYNGKGGMYLTTDTRWLLQETRTGLPAILVGQVTRLTKVTLHDLGIERTIRTWQEKNTQILILYRLCTENAPKMIPMNFEIVDRQVHLPFQLGIFKNT